MIKKSMFFAELTSEVHQTQTRGIE